MISDDEAVARLRVCLDDGVAKLLLEAYFDPSGSFAGALFDRFEPGPANALTSGDLLAVSLLDVSIGPRALRALTDHKAKKVNTLLTELPAQTDLWNANADELAAVEAAYAWLQELDGIGPVIASKILARKRPRLVPIVDRVIVREVGETPGYYRRTRIGMARWLQDAPLQSKLMELVAPLDDGISTLRVLDVVLWMRGSGSRAARKVRAAVGLT